MNRLARTVCVVGLLGSPVLQTGARAAGPPAPVVVKVGAGSYLSAPPAGAKTPGGTPFVTPDFKGPVPTNDWCSSLYWEPFSHPHYAHPLAMKAVPAGLRVFYPGPAVAGTKDAIFGFMPDGKTDRADLTIGHAGVDAFPEKRVAAASDWFVDVRWHVDVATMTLSYGHGSPFVYGEYVGGPARVTFADPPVVWANDKLHWLGVTVGGNKHYGLYSSRGVWTGAGTSRFTCTFLPAAADDQWPDQIVVAVLPEATPEALRFFGEAAGFPVRNTFAIWSYDPSKSEVTTALRFSPVPSRPGRLATDTLTALYPHQWRQIDSALTKYTYASVRGPMKLADTRSGVNRVTSVVPLPAVLPALPRVPGGADPARLAAYLRQDLGPADDDPTVRDTYADGKRLGRWASLIPIAEQYGLTPEAEQLTTRVKARLEDWLTATDAAGRPKAGRAFAYDKTWGTLIGYPASYGSDVELNDHHFHYGYFLRAAGEIARRDPAWAADERWGGMLKLIARDIASPDRRDPLFPFLRNFDPYAGHSWASGHARFGDGNNHESSSEAMNAWYGLLLLGQFTGDKPLRDLGAWLYATEAAAIEDYWFGVHGDTFPPGYTPSVVTMVWGGKGANGTWFSGEPETVHGINFLPVTGGSLYLGRYPEYANKNWQAMLAERKGGPLRQWQDVLLMFRALSDGPDALARFDAAAAAGPDGRPGLKPEAGNSLAATYHWIATLNALGPVDRTVTADHPLAATFAKAGRRTHVAYRGPADAGRAVAFSDGAVIPAGAEGFAVK